MNSCWFTRLKHRKSHTLDSVIEQIDYWCSKDDKYLRLIHNQGRDKVLGAIDQFVSNSLRAKYMLRLGKVKDEWVVFSKNDRKFAVGTRYHVYGFAYRLYLPLFNILEKNHIINVVTGNSAAFSGGKGFSTTYKLDDSFYKADTWDIFYVPAINTMEVDGMSYNVESNIKDQVSTAINISSYYNTLANYITYNTYLSMNDISISLLPFPVGKAKNSPNTQENPLRMVRTPIKIEYSKSYVYDSSTEMINIRLAYSDYQLYPQYVRDTTLINGKETNEADYAGLFVHMAYGITGAQIPDNYYTFIPELPDDANRTISKMLVNFNLSTPDKKAVKRAITSEWAVKASTMGYNTSLKVFLGSYGLDYEKVDCRLFETHYAISEMLEGNSRDQLEMNQAILMESIMMHFLRKGVVVLDVHDSFVCQKEYTENLISTMEEEFKSRFGISIKARIKE